MSTAALPSEVELDLRGGLDGGPPLELDHRRFSYAGKFRMTNAGKAVAMEGEEVVGAASFSADRSDGDAAWIRYLSVRGDHRGEGIGARLAAYIAGRLLGEVARVRIGVNNPFAYEALYKAGFHYTGRQTGLAELVLERPGDRSVAAYQAGYDVFRQRDELSPAERSFLSRKSGAEPPESLG